MSLTLKKVKSNLERVLDKNLQDLVRGIRAHKNNEVRFVLKFDSNTLFTVTIS